MCILIISIDILSMDVSYFSIWLSFLHAFHGHNLLIYSYTLFLYMFLTDYMCVCVCVWFQTNICYIFIKINISCLFI